MTISTNCSPDVESIAAYVDGTLSGHERLAVEAHLANCEACAELLAETYAIANDAAFLEGVEELTPNAADSASTSIHMAFDPSGAGQPTEVDLEPQNVRGATRSRWLIAAGLLAVIATSWWWMSRSPGLQHLSSTELVADLPSAGELRDRLPDGWIDGRWSGMRGGDVVMIAPPKAAFRVGVRTVDLAGALRANAVGDALYLTYRLEEIFPSITGSDMLMLSNYALRQAIEATPPRLDEASERANTLDGQISEIEPTVYVQAGRWASAAELSALAASTEFFSSKEWREGLSLLSAADPDSKLFGIAHRLASVEPRDFATIRKELAAVFSILGQGEERL